jgi:hypothetical protein
VLPLPNQATDRTRRAPGPSAAPALYYIPAVSIAVWLLAMWIAPEPGWGLRAVIGWGIVPFALTAVLAYIRARADHTRRDTWSRWRLVLGSVAVTFAVLFVGTALMFTIMAIMIAENAS